MSWLHNVPGFKPRKPLRAGVLNTGELVLVDDANHAHVFSPLTTDLIRDVLDAPPISMELTPIVYPPLAEKGGADGS